MHGIPKNSDRIINLLIYMSFGEPVVFMAISSEKTRLLRSARNDELAIAILGELTRGLIQKINIPFALFLKEELKLIIVSLRHLKTIL